MEMIQQTDAYLFCFAILGTKPNLIRVIIHIYQVLYYHGIYIKNMAQNFD